MAVPAVLVLIALAVTGCSNYGGSIGSSATSSPSASASALSSADKAARAKSDAVPVTCAEIDKAVTSSTYLKKVQRTALLNKQTRCNEASTGVKNADGSLIYLPLVTGDDNNPQVVDTTTNSSTPPLIAGGLRYKNLTTSWADLVKRVGNQQWYIDAVNARTAQTGFNWNDVLKYAAQTTIDARVIQVYNYPGISDADVRKAVAPYMGTALANKLPIYRLNNFINTRKLSNGSVGNYVDAERMIRVSLVPIVFDANGVPAGLKADNGGVFIDCANIHYVPVQVWVCSDSSCTPPPTPVTPSSPSCTSLQTGVYPNCLDSKLIQAEPQSQGHAGASTYGGGANPAQADPVGSPAGGTPVSVYVPPAAPPAPVIPTGSDPVDSTGSGSTDSGSSGSSGTPVDQGGGGTTTGDGGDAGF